MLHRDTYRQNKLCVRHYKLPSLSRYRPRAPCEPQVSVLTLRDVSSCVVNVDIFFLLFLPFFDFDLDSVCFILSFSCGYYAVSSLSVSAATCLAI